MENKTEFYKEENNMNGITTDGYTANAMYDNIRYGHGWGAGYGAFAGPAANAVRIEAGHRATAAGIENLLDQNQFEATNTNIVTGFNRVCDRISDMEFRTGDRLRDLERDNEARFRSLEKCCCDAKLQACEDKNQILAAIAESKAEMLAVETRGVRDQLNVQRDISLKQEIFATCGCGCGGGVTPCPGS